VITYILINTEIGAIPEVLEAVKKIKEVKEAYSVFGVYDIVLKIEVESTHKLEEMVTRKVRRIDRVRSTTTMIVMEEP
jgi:Lrp/AsnC family transcriptional regulator for asnA, asnC and gidA